MRYLIVGLVLLLMSCASVSVNLTGEARDPISRSDVKKYKNMPQEYVDMGYVTVVVKSYYGGAEANGKIRGEAAKVGANGFYITEKEASKVGFGGGFNATTGGMNPSGSEYTVTGRIFYVER